MNICTDSVRFANQWFFPSPHWRSGPSDQISQEFCQVASRLGLQAPVAAASIDLFEPWQCMVLVERAARSQFDTLVSAMREGESLPHGLACLAGSGEGFHGQRNRIWAAVPGNIHLSLFLSPRCHLHDIGTGLTILPAVSIVQTLDSVPGLENRSGIKWVNDILIGGSKAAGFLVHTQSASGKVTGAVIGIGLNVAATPHVDPTIFVPSVTAAHNHISDPRLCTLPFILGRLLYYLGQNYQKLVTGGVAELLEFYRKRSLIMGREVHLYQDLQDLQDSRDLRDKRVAGGTVLSIGDRLELILEGEPNPMFRGRLVMESETATKKRPKIPVSASQTRKQAQGS